MLFRSSGNGEVVLLVDDEEALVRLNEERLAEMGYEPVGFVDAAEAFSEFRSRPDDFDLVITDLTMPGMSGIDLATGIRAIRRGIPVILVSGFVSAEVSAQAHAAGIVEVLGKPVDHTELAGAIRRALHPRPSSDEGNSGSHVGV